MALEKQPLQSFQEWMEQLTEFAEPTQINLMSTISDKHCKYKSTNGQ